MMEIIDDKNLFSMTDVIDFDVMSL